MTYEERINQAMSMVEIMQAECESLQIGCLRQVGRQEERMIKNTWSPKMFGWARAENIKNNANILVRPTPEVAHPWLILDDLSFKDADQICTDWQALVVETSPENFQLRLLANRPLDQAERAVIQKAFAKEYAADLGAISFDRWGRLAGFANKKEGKEGFWTRLIATPDLKLPKFDPATYLTSPLGGGVLHGVKSIVAPSLHRNGNSESEKEYGFVLNRLRYCLKMGFDVKKQADLLKIELTERSRPRKKNPEYYANLTVERALSALQIK